MIDTSIGTIPTIDQAHERNQACSPTYGTRHEPYWWIPPPFIRM